MPGGLGPRREGKPGRSVARGSARAGTRSATAGNALTPARVAAARSRGPRRVRLGLLRPTGPFGRVHDGGAAAWLRLQSASRFLKSPILNWRFRLAFTTLAWVWGAGLCTWPGGSMKGKGAKGEWGRREARRSGVGWRSAPLRGQPAAAPQLPPPPAPPPTAAADPPYPPAAGDRAAQT